MQKYDQLKEEKKEEIFNRIVEKVFSSLTEEKTKIQSNDDTVLEETKIKPQEPTPTKNHLKTLVFLLVFLAGLGFFLAFS